MTVRDLTWRDFPALVEDYWALYDEVLQDPELGITLFPKRPTLGEEAEWFARLYRQVQDREAVAGVVEEEGRAVGLCTIRRKNPTREAAHVGVLGISIAKAWRGKGLGRPLMEHTLDRGRGLFELVELCAFATNARALALYESLGFRRWGLQPRATRRGDRYIDEVYMQLELGTATGTAPPPAGPE